MVRRKHLAISLIIVVSIIWIVTAFLPDYTLLFNY